MEPETFPLFWSDEYWSINTDALRQHSKVIGPKGEVICVSTGVNGSAVPGNATFGGWWVPDSPNYSVANYVAMFSSLLGQFPSSGWEFNLPPAYFFPEVFNNQARALSDMGFRAVDDTNSTICFPQSAAPPSEAFFSRGNRKRIRAFREKGGSVRQAIDTELRDAFRLLASNRVRRGAELSVSEERFLGLARGYPSIYKCWLALIDDEPYGVAYTVEISAHATYVLYWGDSIAGRALSVVASLCDKLQAVAWGEGKEFLDLGTSSVAGEVDEGLLTFKKNLGAVSFRQSRFYMERPPSNL
jgi:hypothetical protein